MHVLTKIFIVLVSLLAVLMVPLVVVYAYNENSYSVRYQRAVAESAAVSAEMNSREAAHSAEITRKDAENQSLTEQNIQLRADANRDKAELRKLETSLAEAEAFDSEIAARLAGLDASHKASQTLIQTLIDEGRENRRELLAAQRQKVELDEALKDAIAKLDVAIEARRAMQEELQRLKDDQAGLLNEIQVYASTYGALNRDQISAGMLTPVNVSLDATVLNVRQGSVQTLVEIDAGERDGVKVGMEVPIGRGGSFVANLRITEVDINRSTGVIELQSLDVKLGDRVLFRPKK